MTSPSHDDRHDDEASRTRPRYRPPAGLPLPRESYRAGALVSLGFHLLVVLLILTPLFVASILAAPPEGAGGAGPAGGGGGGTRGTGGSAESYTPERLRYIQIAPQPAASPEAAQPEPVPPPPPEKKPEPEPTPPVSQQEPVPPAEPLVGSADAQVASALPGTGGGTGDDGTRGTGPGTGGGVGSGEGTGRGSGTGPGTGGGFGDVYLPTATLSVFPNRKPRDGVAGDSIVVLFDVDSTGRVLRVEFPPTRDRGFNKYLADVLENWKFRPAVRADGTPIRATYPLVIFL